MMCTLLLQRTSISICVAVMFSFSYADVINDVMHALMELLCTVIVIYVCPTN
jgi:hypothetical protein